MWHSQPMDRTHSILKCRGSSVSRSPTLPNTAPKKAAQGKAKPAKGKQSKEDGGGGGVGGKKTNDLADLLGALECLPLPLLRFKGRTHSNRAGLPRAWLGGACQDLAKGELCLWSCACGFILLPVSVFFWTICWLAERVQGLAGRRGLPFAHTLTYTNTMNNFERFHGISGWF